jgi:hypothetical protein
VRSVVFAILLSLFSFKFGASEALVKSEPQVGAKKVGVKRVRFVGVGDLIFPPKKLEKEMDLREETPKAVEEGVNRLRSFYLLQGYLNANVRSEIEGELATVYVEPGSKYELPAGFCTDLQRQRRAAEKRGIIDFSARFAPGDSAPQVETGGTVRVGRIEFIGNHSHTDSWMRRSMLIMEGEILDSGRVRRSLDRLRRTGQFERVEVAEPIREGDIAHITIRVKENKRGFWRISGPAGPVRIGGSLDAALGVRIFSTLLVAASVAPIGPPFLTTAARLTPVLSLTRPFTPGDGWLSGITIAPQLGWRLGSINMVEGYGTAQLQQRLFGLLAGDRQPELPITIERKTGDAVMYCPTPPQKLRLLRIAATFGVYALGML